MWPDLPAGFKFRPTEKEMCKYFLKKKALGEPMRARIIPQEFPLLFSIHPRYLPGDSTEKHWYYYCRKRNDQVNTNHRGLWTRTGEETYVFDPEQNGALLGIQRRFALTEQQEESSGICISDDDQSPKYNWFLDEISLPGRVAVTDWAMCHVFRKKIKPKTPEYLSEEEEEETESEMEEEDETKSES